MKNDSIDFESLLQIHKQLKSEHLEKIDFDVLIEQLGKVISLHKKHKQLQSEFQVLQSSLISKISIMEKASLVVSRKRPDLKEIDRQKEELFKRSANELLEQFEKSESKFHASFPVTFQFQKKYTSEAKNYSSYK